MEIRVRGLKAIQLFTPSRQIRLRVRGIKGEPIFAEVPKDLLTLIFESWERLFLSVFQPEYDFFTENKFSIIYYHPFQNNDFTSIRDFDFAINNNNTDNQRWFNPNYTAGSPLCFPYDLYFRFVYNEFLTRQVEVKVFSGTNLIASWTSSEPFDNTPNYFPIGNFATYDNQLLLVEIKQKGWRAERTKSFYIIPYFRLASSHSSSYPNTPVVLRVETGPASFHPSQKWNADLYLLISFAPDFSNSYVFSSTNSQELERTLFFAPFQSTFTTSNQVYSQTIYLKGIAERNSKTYTKTLQITSQSHSYFDINLQPAGTTTVNLTQTNTTQNIIVSATGGYPNWWESSSPTSIYIPRSSSDDNGTWNAKSPNLPANSDFTSSKTINVTVSKSNCLVPPNFTTHSITKPFTIYRKHYIQKTLPSPINNTYKILYKGYGIDAGVYEDTGWGYYQRIFTAFKLEFPDPFYEPLPSTYTFKYAQYTETHSLLQPAYINHPYLNSLYGNFVGYPIYDQTAHNYKLRLLVPIPSTNKLYVLTWLYTFTEDSTTYSYVPLNGHWFFEDNDWLIGTVSLIKARFQSGVWSSESLSSVSNRAYLLYHKPSGTFRLSSPLPIFDEETITIDGQPKKVYPSYLEFVQSLLSTKLKIIYSTSSLSDGKGNPAGALRISSSNKWRLFLIHPLLLSFPPGSPYSTRNTFRDFIFNYAYYSSAVNNNTPGKGDAEGFYFQIQDNYIAFINRTHLYIFTYENNPQNWFWQNHLVTSPTWFNDPDELLTKEYDFALLVSTQTFDISNSASF